MIYKVIHCFVYSFIYILFPKHWVGFSEFHRVLLLLLLLLLLFLLLLLCTPLLSRSAKPLCCTPLPHPSYTPLYLRPPVPSWASSLWPALYLYSLLFLRPSVLTRASSFWLLACHLLVYPLLSRTSCIACSAYSLSFPYVLWSSVFSVSISGVYLPYRSFSSGSGFPNQGNLFS